MYKADGIPKKENRVYYRYTKALFGETIANPAISVLDIEKIDRIAHQQ